MRLRCSILGLLCALFLTGCGAQPVTYYGTYCDVTIADKKAAYQKSYLMMDCCEEWGEFCDFVDSVCDAAVVEGYEYYLYDNNGSVIDSSKEREIVFYPTKEFQEHAKNISGGAYQIFHLGDKEPIPIVDVSNGVHIITDEQGIFVLTLSGESDGKPYISNINCEGQCRACE